MIPRRPLQTWIAVLGLACGAQAQVTWTEQISGTQQPLNAVHFVNADTGWIVGGLGTILATTNGGASWTPQTSGTRMGLESVFFLDAKTGWAAGSTVVIKTTDGGLHWQNQGAGFYLFKSIHFSDAKRGWANGDRNAVLRTVDGGSTWKVFHFNGNYQFHALRFISLSKGFMVGTAGAVAVTEDGGVSWNLVLPFRTGATLTSVAFLGSQRGFAVGTNGNVLSTTNGGAAWSSTNVGMDRTLQAVSFADRTSVWAVGGRIIAHSGGGSWTAESSGIYWHGVHFVDANTGWIVGDGGAIRKSSRAVVGLRLPIAPQDGLNRTLQAWNSPAELRLHGPLPGTWRDLRGRRLTRGRSVLWGEPN